MVAQAGGRTNALKHEIVIRITQPSAAAPDHVYAVLADPNTHAIWGGERQGKKTRLIEVRTQDVPVVVGSEFTSVGADPTGRFDDRSVMTEAAPGRTFEFVTESRLTTKKGAVADWTNIHRYEIEPSSSGCTIGYSLRVVLISALPGMLAVFNIPGLSGLARRASAGMLKRGLRNLARFAEGQGTA